MLPPHLRGIFLVSGLSALTASFAIACGGGGDGGSAPPGSQTSEENTIEVSSDRSAAPVHDPPVSQFSILVQDLGVQNFLTDLASTWKISKEDYAATGAFVDYDSGLASLTSWDYVEGYETALIPEGGNEAIFNGGYVVHQEIHLFKDADGAKGAFEYFTETVKNNGISSPLTVDTVGNESFTSRTVAGKVGGDSHVDQVLHQLIFRRGNVVAVVLTIGAAPLMQAETVVELSAMVDQKLLDEREHPEPTPIPERSNQSTAGIQGTPSP